MFNLDEQTVTLTMSVGEYEELLVFLGYAGGAMLKNGDDLFQVYLKFVNRLNEGNPRFTPYETRDEE